MKENKRKAKITNILLTSLVLTENEQMNLKYTIIDVYDEFIEIRFKFIKKAILRGIREDYKKGDKLSTQLFCVWIREYLNEVKLNKPKF